MQKYPIGIQTFSDLREGGFVYVDKTEYMMPLIEGSKYYFLSRPRRFGKSLLLSTLSDIFKGNKHLFKDLWIEDKINWDEYDFPVIHLSFASMAHRAIGLEKGLEKALDSIANHNDLVLKSDDYTSKFQELIVSLYKKHQKSVVVLIDEYDTPVVDYLGENLDKARKNQEILRSFYSVVKDSDPFIRFFFLTGISRFTKMSIFSTLNNLNDISIDEEYATLCGYTQEELLSYFLPNIQKIALKSNLKEADCIDKITKWYNGFCFSRTAEQKVYNPYSILLFLQKKDFSNYWFSTGSPAFLIKMLNQNFDYDLDDTTLSEIGMENFNLDSINYRTVLFQTGYLTIKERIEGNKYRIGFPNHEVKESMFAYILDGYLDKPPIESTFLVDDIRHLLIEGKTEEVIQHIHQLFSKIPNELFRQHYENFYHAIIFTAFKLLGCNIQCEVSHAKGRIDAIVHTPQYLYIFEFKVDASAQEAMQQIKEKNYAMPFLNTGKKIILIGINFTEDARGIQESIVEEI
jgi:Predicted AAA-ATPase/PD-(D/E)XK nuclease superfamily